MLEKLNIEVFSMREIDDLGIKEVRNKVNSNFLNIKVKCSINIEIEFSITLIINVGRKEGFEKNKSSIFSSSSC